MNAYETTRQRNARLRADIEYARQRHEEARIAAESAHDDAVTAGVDSDLWDRAYDLECAEREAQSELDMAESEYRLRDVPQATRDLVFHNID